MLSPEKQPHTYKKNTCVCKRGMPGSECRNVSHESATVKSRALAVQLTEWRLLDSEFRIWNSSYIYTFDHLNL